MPYEGCSIDAVYDDYKGYIMWPGHYHHRTTMRDDMEQAVSGMGLPEDPFEL